MKRRQTTGRQDRRGAIALLILFLMIPVLALVAFALDVGYIAHVRTELQRSADACAMAGAFRLPDKVAAKEAVLFTVQQNPSGDTGILKTADIEFGHWNRDTATFTSPAPYGDPNAVRVTVRRTEAAGNPVSLFFANLLGTDSANVTATSTAMYDRQICGPLVGVEWVSVPGDPVTSSYDAEADPLATNRRNRGGVCSDGPITVEGQAQIYGSARAGVGQQVTVEGAPLITGNIGTRLRPLNLPPVDASNAALSNDNDSLPLIQKGNDFLSPVDGSGNFVLDGSKNYTLPEGTYYFNDMTLSGEAVLNITGSVKIYLTGNLYRAGGVTVNNNTLAPSSFQIYMTGGWADVTSHDAFYGAIYAPNTSIRLAGSADYFGAFVGRTLTMTGSGEAHYDESLGLGGVEFPRRTALVD